MTRSAKDTDWSARCEFWGSQALTSKPRKLRERSAETLVLCGHGIALRVDAGTLFIKNGFTHYPQEQEVFRYFRGDLDRPARIIVLDGSGHLTFAVLDWLAEQDVPLIRVSWTGDVVTVAGGSGYGASREKIDWQRATRADERRRLAFGCDLIRRKLENSILTLETALPAHAARSRAVSVASAALRKLDKNPPTNVSELHGVEGPAAAAYFEAWQGTLLNWRTDKRRPIPEGWRTLGPRASLRAGKKSKNRNATHPVNAMLNYGYAIAVAHLKIQALADGYDPTLGIMHDGQREAPAYALDLIEPVRPLVDRAILDFTLGREMHPADFVLRSDGACRLNPQSARLVVQLAQDALTDVS